MGYSAPLILEIMTKLQLVDKLMARSREANKKGKGVSKVVPSELAAFVKTLFKISITVVEGLIEGASQNTRYQKYRKRSEMS